MSSMRRGTGIARELDAFRERFLSYINPSGIEMVSTISGEVQRMRCVSSSAWMNFG
jgi:hypothetical protein